MSASDSLIAKRTIMSNNRQYADLPLRPCDVPEWVKIAVINGEDIGLYLSYKMHPWERKGHRIIWWILDEPPWIKTETRLYLSRADWAKAMEIALGRRHDKIVAAYPQTYLDIIWGNDD